MRIQSAHQLRKQAVHQEDQSCYPQYFAELVRIAQTITALANRRDKDEAEQRHLEELICWYAVERDLILVKLSGRR